MLTSKDFPGLTDEELYAIKMESGPGSNYWEWATAEQQERQRTQNRAVSGPEKVVTSPISSEIQLKMFWSWQSDTPGKIGRFLVRDALRGAIEELKQVSDIEEPLREALHLDHDIQNVPGSPDLARTIFAKIEKSRVVIADVTMVGQSTSEAGNDKKLINSNVAIELGYALHACTDQNVLLVFNEHYGTYEDLPFDLRHKGGAIVFKLAPDAVKSEIDAQKKHLKHRFVQALKPFLKASATPALIPFEETPYTFNRAAYFRSGEVLARCGHDLEYRQTPLCYARLIPKKKAEKPFRLATLKEVVLGAPLLRDNDYTSLCHDLNRYGAIVCSSSDTRLFASTQIFRTGEIWCISASLIRTEREEVPRHLQLPAASIFVLEQIYYDTALKLVDFSKRHLGLEPPWDLELGVSNVEGVFLNWRPDPWSGQSGPIHAAEITERALLRNGDEQELTNVLLSFFEKIFDSIGERRPENLHGFPANRPRRS